MKFGVYCMRDVKAGFMSPTISENDPIAARAFGDAVLRSDSVLLNYASDFALYRMGDFDSNSGRITPLDVPVLVIQATDILAGQKEVK